jgi:quercetin dioxygenase-like cupin family protein
MAAMSTVQSRPPEISTRDASYYRTLPDGGPMEDLHTHDHVTTVCVLQGVVYLVSEDDERAMTPGDEATIPAGSLHRLFNAGDGEAHVLEGLRPAHCQYAH